MQKNYVRICPQCGSTDLFVDTPNISAPMMIASKCRGCGYSGVCPEIEISMVKDFKKEIKKKRAIPSATRQHR